MPRPSGRIVNAMSRLPGGLLVVVALLASACVPPPAARSSGPWSGSAVGDQEVRREYARLKARSDARREQDLRRVERVGRRLLAAIPSHPDVKFVIVPNDPSINAGATFGEVAVTSGMLGFIRSDDEMAVVLGHELAHVTEGHVTQGALSGLALSVLAVILESRAPGAGQAASGIGQLFLSHYTQTQERVADAIGLRYAYQAGYDPRAAVEVMERLAVEAPQTLSAGFFDSHPSSPERAVAARKESEELLAQGSPPGREEVLATERGAKADAERRSFASEEPRPEGRRSTADVTRVDDPRGFRAAAGSVERAAEDCERGSVYVDMARDAATLRDKETYYRRAIRVCPTTAEPHVGLGRVLRERGDDDGARREFRRALEIDPADEAARAALRGG